MPLPRTLLARITLVVVAGMVIAQALTFMAIRYERGQAMQTLMISGVERDIASSIAVLDRVPAAERPEWLDRLERPNFRFALTGDVDTPPPASGPLRQFVDVITAALKPYPVLAVGQVPSMREAVRMQVRLLKGEKSVMTSNIVAAPGAPAIVGGHRHGTGVLIIILWADPVPVAAAPK